MRMHKKFVAERADGFVHVQLCVLGTLEPSRSGFHLSLNYLLSAAQLFAQLIAQEACLACLGTVLLCAGECS